MSIKRIVIAAGGTGGHLYPAQGLAEELLGHPKAPDVLFVAGGLKKSRYFDQKTFPFQEVSCRPLVSKNPLRAVQGAYHLAKGVWQSRQILKNYQPDVVIGFGSYYTVPTLLAAKSLKIPFILHEANSIPGQANRWLASFAHSVALHFPATASSMPKNTKCIEVGLPLRKGYRRQAVDKQEALRYFQLEDNRQTWLVCGGSQGAQAINQLMEKVLSELASYPLQFIHLTGNSQAAAYLQKCYNAQNIPACVKPFENQMKFAWRAADTFIGRAGASTIAESLEFEVPGILIPYPFATNQHQDKNADFLVETVKAGYKRSEKELTPKQLACAIQSLTRSPQLEVFQWALHCYKQRPSQITLDEWIFSLGDL